MSFSFKRQKLTTLYLALLILLTKRLFDISIFLNWSNIVDSFVSILIVFLFACTICKQRFNSRKIVFYCLLSTLTLYSALVTKLMILPTTVLIILAIAEEPIEDIASFLLRWKIYFLIIHTLFAILLYVLGFISIFGESSPGRNRCNLGFEHPAFFSDYVLDILMLWVLLSKKANLNSFLMLFTIAILTYIITDSKTTLIAMFFLAIGFVLVTRQLKYNKVLLISVRYIIPILTIFTLLAMFLFYKKNEFGILLDSLLTTRIRLNGFLFSMYGFSIFGQYMPSYEGDFSLEWLSTGSTSDSTYIWLIIQWGIAWLIILILSFYYYSKKKNNPKKFLLLIIWALCALTDTDFLNGIVSFPILLLSELIGLKNKRNNYNKCELSVEKNRKKTSCFSKI